MFLIAGSQKGKYLQFSFVYLSILIFYTFSFANISIDIRHYPGLVDDGDDGGDVRLV